MFMFVTRWLFYFIGLLTFSYGITIALSMQHLGIHPWDVLAVALFEKLGLSIGTWAIIISLILIIVSWFLDKSYIKLGTFLNGVLVAAFVDLFLWIDFLPNASLTWTDSLIMIGGMVVMGIGGGLYNSAQVGSGPRDGFMLSIADKTNAPIGRVRIIVESFILLLLFILGGPVFWFTLIFTFVQSPVFAYSFTRFKTVLSFIERRHHTTKNKSEAV